MGNKLSPSPYGDSCFSDVETEEILTFADDKVSVPLRGFVFL